MFSDFDEISDALSTFDAFRRQVGRTSEARVYGFVAQVHEDGDAFVLRADLPGASDEDVNVSVHENVVTVSGARKADAPEGYSIHRRERPALSVSRSWSLPTKIDADNVSAELKNGLLEVRLPKSPENKPRQIPINVLAKKTDGQPS